MQKLSDGVEENYRWVRRRAWVSSIRGRLGLRLTDLLSVPDLRTRVQVRGQGDLGINAVALDRIAGSEGRPGDFDRHFAIRQANPDERWMRNRRAHTWLDSHNAACMMVPANASFSEVLT